MDYYPYPCKQCGNCCRHVDLIENMNFLNRGDGVCKHLTSENLCEIYSSRPSICNGEYVYKKFFPNMTVEEFHKIVSKLCQKLREAEN